MRSQLKRSGTQSFTLLGALDPTGGARGSRVCESSFNLAEKLQKVLPMYFQSFEFLAAIQHWMEGSFYVNHGCLHNLGVSAWHGPYVGDAEI